MKKNKIILSFLSFMIMQIAVSQEKLSDALFSISSIKPIELMNHVRLIYTSKRNRSILFLVPKNKIPVLKRLSKNEKLFMNEIILSDSIYFYQHFGMQIVDDVFRNRIDTTDLFLNSEIAKFNFFIYKSNYDCFEEYRTLIVEESYVLTKLNKKLKIIEDNHYQFYTGYVHTKYFDFYNERISNKKLVPKWNNIMIPFVFTNYHKLAKW